MIVSNCKETYTTYSAGRILGKCTLIQLNVNLLDFQINRIFISFNYHIHNVTLEEVTNLKYLDVTIDRNLTWKEHVNIITNRANI